ncbi:hypothetical protein ACQJBY_052116 [Aegilops geniculata]
MELFAHAKAVRLKSRHDKFLYADEDELHVTQDRNGSSPSARWTVEPVPHAPGASSDSFSAPLHKVEGRAIHYHIADDKGDVDDDIERRSFTFNGSNLEELTQKLQEETGIDDLIVCTRSPISGKLTPLLLQLPPNNAAMHIVLVRESSKDRESAKDSRVL